MGRLSDAQVKVVQIELNKEAQSLICTLDIL